MDDKVSARDRLKRRNRPVVEERKPFVAPENQPSIDSENQPSIDSENQELKDARINASKNKSIQETEHTTVRLEVKLKQRLDKLCSKHKKDKVTRETLFEALFIYLEGHPEIQDEILAEAQRRGTIRAKLGVRRRAQVMLKNE